MLGANPLGLKRGQNLLQPLGHSRGALPGKRLLMLTHIRDLLTGKCPGITEIHHR